MGIIRTMNNTDYIDYNKNYYNDTDMMGRHETTKKFSPTIHNFDISILDQNIVKCNVKDINDRIEIIDHDGGRLVKIKNIYANPYAVRKLISKIPHALSRSYSDNFYPGYSASCHEVNLDEFSKIVKKTAIANFEYMADKIKSKPLIFETGIFTQKNILAEELPLIIHTDSFYGIAGIVYLNFPEETNGGTAFYRKNKKTKEYECIYKNEMEFNTLVIYDSGTFHGIYFDTQDAFSDSYRITQRFFLTAIHHTKKLVSETQEEM